VDMYAITCYGLEDFSQVIMVAREACKGSLIDDMYLSILV